MKPDLTPAKPISEALAQEYEERYQSAVETLFPESWRLPAFRVPPGTVALQVSIGLKPNGETTPLIRFLSADGTQIVAAAEVEGEGGGGVIDSGFPCPPYCG